MKEVKVNVYSIEELEETAKCKAVNRISEILNDDFWYFCYPENLKIAQERFWEDYGFCFDAKQIELDIEHRFCRNYGVDRTDIDLLRLCKAASVNEKTIDMLKRYSELEDPIIETLKTDICVYFADVNDEFPAEVHLMMEKLSDLLSQFMLEKFDGLANEQYDMWYESISEEACIDYANELKMLFYNNGEQFFDLCI